MKAADAGQCSATFTLPALAATDNCGVASVSSNAPASFPVGTTTVTWTVVDIHDNTNTCTQTVTVLAFRVVGLVEMEAFAGPLGNGAGRRIVTFKVTDSGGTVLEQRDLELDFSNGVAGYALDNLPMGTVRLSAKTAWTLRKRLELEFDNCLAVANFTGDHSLWCCDFDDSNTPDFADHFALAAAWYTSAAVADGDGSGFVDLDDYFLLANHWLLSGDPE